VSTTLSYGFVQPETGDKGSVFWPALEDLIQQVNDHTHNGTNSSRLTAAALEAVSQSVSSAGWGSTIGGGLYRQTVTVPAALTGPGGTYDDYSIEIRNSANGRRLFLQTEKVTTTTFYVFINDNSISLTVIYS
jgi:hypothetical protein